MDVVNDKSKKKLILRFLRNPVEFYKKGNRLGGVKLEKMKLYGKAEYQKVEKSEEPDAEAYQTLKCDLLIKSIGYKSLAMPGVPFDKKRNTIPNQFGCVENPDGSVEVGLYCAGWVKRGPVGIIDATMRDAMDTFRVIKHHLDNDMLLEKKTTREEVM